MTCFSHRRDQMLDGYPNGKIYVGMDLTDTLLYFGSVRRALVGADFSAKQRSILSYPMAHKWEAALMVDPLIKRLPFYRSCGLSSVSNPAWPLEAASGNLNQLLVC